MKKKIEEKMEDPPFLNRFEKHIFSFEYLMNEGELRIAKNIIEYFNKILLFNKKDCQIDLQKQVLWYNSEEIKGLVVKNCYEYDREGEDWTFYLFNDSECYFDGYITSYDLEYSEIPDYIWKIFILHYIIYSIKISPN